MTDSFLFIVSPYLTAAAVSGCIARYAFTTRRDGDDAAAARGADAMSRPVRAAWRWAIGFVAAGHLLALGFPESVLRWNQQPLRLLALETAGLVSAIAALAALIAMAVRRVRAADAGAVHSPFDVIAWTLLLIEIVSGLAVALFYRWGSSWSAVTIAPYVQSLFRLDPDAVLIARLPLAARLHVFCAFALFAVVPYSRAARALMASIDRAASRLAGRASSAVPSWCAPDALSARVQPLRVRLIRDEGEEN